MAPKPQAKSPKSPAKIRPAHTRSRGPKDAPTAPRTSAPRRRADGKRTRARVLAAATEVFARDGFEGASLRRIAEAAEVDIATLKYHVGDKASLFAEVYQDGYQHFQQVLGPLLLRMPLARDPEELMREVRNLFDRGYDYLEENQRFVRLWLFRLLEAPNETVFEAEQRMRGQVLDLIEAAVTILRERGLVRDVDLRVVALVFVAALPTVALAAQAEPALLGPSAKTSRERFIDFFVGALRSYMLIEAPSVR